MYIDNAQDTILRVFLSSMYTDNKKLGGRKKKIAIDFHITGVISINLVKENTNIPATIPIITILVPINFNASNITSFENDNP